MKQKAYSLIEVLTVMAIAAVVLASGLMSLVGLRNKFTVRQASSEFIQNFSSVRNDARNNVIRGKTNNDTANVDLVLGFDYFAIKIEKNEYYRGTCKDQADRVVCDFDDRSLKSTQNNNVDIVVAPTGCEGIVFNRSTGKFAFGTVVGTDITLNTGDECRYTFKHASTRYVEIEILADRKKGKLEIV